MPATETSHTNPVKAIRLKCLDCSGGSSEEVKKCVIPHCPLYPFRFGKNPFRTPMSEEQRKACSERAKKRFASTQTALLEA